MRTLVRKCVFILCGVFTIPLSAGCATLVIDFQAIVSASFTSSSTTLGDVVTGKVTVDLDALPYLSGGAGNSWYLYDNYYGVLSGMSFEAQGPAFSYVYYSGDSKQGVSLQSMISLRDGTPFDSAVFQVSSSQGDRMLVLGFEDSLVPYDFVVGSSIPLSFALSDVNDALFVMWSGGVVEFEGDVTGLSVAVIPEAASLGAWFGVLAYLLAFACRRVHGVKYKEV